MRNRGLPLPAFHWVHSFFSSFTVDSALPLPSPPCHATTYFSLLPSACPFAYVCCFPQLCINKINTSMRTEPIAELRFPFPPLPPLLPFACCLLKEETSCQLDSTWLALTRPASSRLVWFILHSLFAKVKLIEAFVGAPIDFHSGFALPPTAPPIIPQLYFPYSCVPHLSSAPWLPMRFLLLFTVVKLTLVNLLFVECSDIACIELGLP